MRNGVPSSRWYTGTGIYRDVNLYQGGQIHIAPDDVRLTTLQAEQDLAVVRIETGIRSITQAVTDVKVRHKIMNDKGDVVAQTEYPVTMLPAERKTVSARIEIENPKLWNVDSPNLYTCVTTVQWGDQEDEQIDRFGIRTLQLDTSMACESTAFRQNSAAAVSTMTLESSEPPVLRSWSSGGSCNEGCRLQCDPKCALPGQQDTAGSLRRGRYAGDERVFRCMDQRENGF